MALDLLLHVHDCPHCGVSLKAADQLAEEDLNALPRGKQFMALVKRSRSLPQHRLLFGIIRKVARSTPTPITEGALRDYLTVETGNVDIVPLGLGKSYAAPRSWSFENMDQGEFQKLFDEVVKMILERFSPVLANEVVAEVLAMLEDKRSSKGASSGGESRSARAA